LANSDLIIGVPKKPVKDSAIPVHSWPDHRFLETAKGIPNCSPLAKGRLQGEVNLASIKRQPVIGLLAKEPILGQLKTQIAVTVGWAA
jgi:hypothetical protein